MSTPLFPIEELAAYAVHTSEHLLKDETLMLDVYVSDLYVVAWEDPGDLCAHRTLTVEGARYFAHTRSPHFYVIAYRGKVAEQRDTRHLSKTEG